MTQRIAVSARWVLTGIRGGVPQIVPDATVVIGDGRVAGITTAPVEAAERYELPANTLVLPGFVDLHCHTLNGPLFRAVTEDRPRATTGGTLVYDVLMPVGDLAAQLFSDDEARAVYTAGLLRILAGGTTTLMDVFRLPQASFLEAARDVGIRAYGAPYVASRRVLGIDTQGRPRATAVDPAPDMARIRELHERFDEGADGRLRVAFGPHCTDTCSPELLREIMETARELGTLVTIHTAQSRPEVRYMEAEYGRTPVRYLVDHGVAGPGVVAAHCAFATDEDVTLLADTGTSVACCPAIFAHGGTPVDYRRFAGAGVVTGIGTDGHSLRYLDELRTAGFVAKLRSGAPQPATAVDLLRVATRDGADALGRADLGRLEAGAQADLVALTLDDPGVQPVLDPLRTTVWHPGGVRTSLVMVQGEVLVRDGRHVRIDAADVERQASAAVQRVWDEAERRYGIRAAEVPV